VKSFARVTKLPNVGGRADYITDPGRQEKILAASPGIDWKPYQEFERENKKSSAKNNEGREIMIALPNEWQHLPLHELEGNAQQLAVTATGKDSDMQWAVHLNSAGTKDSRGRVREVDNLHLHVVFSERTKEEIKAPASMKRWDRDIYHTEGGKVAKNKAQRAKNEDGTDKPPVHRKGDLQIKAFSEPSHDGMPTPLYTFSAKDERYKAKSWTFHMKQRVNAEMERMGVAIEPPGIIKQQHEGKGLLSPAIRESNSAVRRINAVLSDVSAKGVDNPPYRP